MKALLQDIEAWTAAGLPIAIATVTRTFGSAPRGAGAKMAVAPDHRISGSVSGGCIEGAVYEAGMEVLESGRARALRFGVSDDQALEVGLACGGTIELLVEPLAVDTLARWRKAQATRHPLACELVLAGPEVGARRWRWAGEAGAGDALNTALSNGRCRNATREGVETFIDVIAPPYALIVIGAAHMAIPLAVMAGTLGYAVTVIDPRAAFATRARFPGVDQLIVDWPARALDPAAITSTTAIVAVTHDPKIDDEALMRAVRSPAFYVGALGNPTTHANRLARLAGRGLTDAELARIHGGPVGLDLAAHDPGEIAVAILAQLVAVRNGRAV